MSQLPRASTPIRPTAREDAAQIMLRKNWAATGSFLKEDRPRALDLLGFESQLVFNTFVNQALLKAERGDDLDFAYGFARAHNRAMVDFCAVDRAPARDLLRAAARLRDEPRDRGARRSRAGAKALLVPSGCPRGHSPSHPGLFPVWEQAEEAGLPVVFHVGGGLRAADDGCSTATTSRTAARPCPTSTAATRTSARSTTWRSRPRRCRRSPR